MRYIFAILTDAVFLAYAYGGASVFRVYMGAPVESLQTLLYAALPFLVIHVVSFALLEAYDFDKTRSESDVGFSAALGVVAASLISLGVSTAFIAYYAPDAQVVPRSVFLMAGVLSLVFLPGWRIWYTHVRRLRGDLRTRVIVVGPADRVAAVEHELAEYSRSGHDIIGRVALDSAPNAAEGFLGSFDDLSRLVEEHHADEILVIGEGLADNASKLVPMVDLCDRTRVRTHILPGFYETMVARLDLYEIGGLPLIELRKDPVTLSYGYAKRAMDVFFACLGLLIASPILALSAVAIRLDSPGPVFFRQRRVGRFGKEFPLLKLRSMRMNAEAATGPVWATKQDPRVTRVGRFLRSKRIDEIPQLWNVLKGAMSLVGPRPERPYFIKKFSDENPLFPLRLRVRPGLTSLSHVWGRYDSDPADRLRYDLFYINNISLMLDIRILVETIKIVLTGRGAQ